MPTPIPEDRYCILESGLTLHVTEAGKKSRGQPTVLCLHGGGPGASGYSNFKNSLSFFSEHGYHTIAPDLAGFGLSDKPTDISYTSQFHVDCLLELCDQLEIDSFIPVGNSLGGSVALELYFAAPKRVPSLILMAPGGLADPATFWGTTEGGSALAKYSRERPGGISEFQDILALLVHDPDFIDDTVIAERYPIAKAQPACVFTSVSIQPTWEKLGEITCPVLCFWGSNDRFLPVSQSLILLQEVPQAKVVISNQAGHWYMLELPNDFNREVVQFLTSSLGAPIIETKNEGISQK